MTCRFTNAVLRRAIGAPLLPILCSVSLLTGCEKYRLDAQVKEMCAKDGGIKVYETVRLPPEKFDQWGNITLRPKRDATAADDYYFERETEYYKTGNPEMSRSVHKIIRRIDGKILGESIHYARGGGDLPGPWHDSTFICPDPRNEPSLERSIFLRGEGK